VNKTSTKVSAATGKLYLLTLTEKTFDLNLADKERPRWMRVVRG